MSYKSKFDAAYWKFFNASMKFIGGTMAFVCTLIFINFLFFPGNDFEGQEESRYIALVVLFIFAVMGVLVVMAEPYDPQKNNLFSFWRRKDGGV